MKHFLCCIVTLFVTDRIVAQEKNTAVGSSYRAYIVQDQRTDLKSVHNRTGKQHCLVLENGLNPALAVFSNQVPSAADAPLAKLLKEVAPLITTYKSERFNIFTVFQTLSKEFHADDQRDTEALKVSAFGKALNLPDIPLALAHPGSKGANSWKVNDVKNVDITVIFFHKLKEIKRWSFKVDQPLSNEKLQEITAFVQDYMK